MNPRFFLTLSLLAVFLLVSCAPAAVPAPVEPEAPVQAVPAENEPPAPAPVEPTAAPPEVPPTEALPMQAAPTEAAPAFVSRGPNLEATDPTTVSLESGDLQLVEFFRFT